MKTISDFCKDAAFMSIRQEINDRRIEVYNQKFLGPIDLGVNWSAIGTVSPEETIEFATKLLQAAHIAKNHPMNGARVVYGKDD